MQGHYKDAGDTRQSLSDMTEGGGHGGMDPEASSSVRALERWGQLGLVLLFILALPGGVALLVRQGNPRGVEVVLPVTTSSPLIKAH